MKTISRALLLTLFCLLVFGGTRTFAGQQPNPKGTVAKDEGIIQNLIDDILDIFSGPKTGSGNSGGSSSGNAGSPTAPIDGGISLLLAAGVGLGVKKMADRKANPNKE